MMRRYKCKICKGEGWVCEDHPGVAWGDGDNCCGGAGQLCDCQEELKKKERELRK